MTTAGLHKWGVLKYAYIHFHHSNCTYLFWWVVFTVPHTLFVHSPNRNTAPTQIKLLWSRGVRTISVKLTHAQTIDISIQFRTDDCERFEMYVHVKSALVINILFFIPNCVAVVEMYIWTWSLTETCTAFSAKCVKAYVRSNSTMQNLIVA
jgi:hypothetical protein